MAAGKPPAGGWAASWPVSRQRRSTFCTKATLTENSSAISRRVIAPSSQAAMNVRRKSSE
jgi:hypothetical protein